MNDSSYDSAPTIAPSLDVPPRPARASTRSRGLGLAIRALISGGLVAWMVAHAAVADIVAAFAAVNPAWLALAIVLLFNGSFLTAWRWRLLLTAQGVHLPQHLLFLSCIVAIFFKQFLPATLGGDASRFYDACRMGAPRSVAAIALVVDRVLGLLALVLVAAVMLPFATELTDAYPGLYAWVLVAAAALLLTTLMFFAPDGAMIHRVGGLARLVPEKVQRKLERTTAAVKAYRGRARELSALMVLSLALQLNVILFYWTVAQALGLAVPAAAWLVIVPIAIVVMLIPVSINAIGVREAIFVFLLAAYGVSTGEALAFAWLEYAMFLMYGLLGGVVFLLRRPAPPRQQV